LNRFAGELTSSGATTARGLLDDDGYRRQLARLRTMRSDAPEKVEAADGELEDKWYFTAHVEISFL
jgi:hypothetical protein